MKYVLLSAGLGILLSMPTLGQNQDHSVPLTRISETITLDGESSEPVWEQIDPFSMTTQLPVFGRPPSEKTEIRAAYDDNYLYFSLRAYDSDPEGIRHNIMYRDQWGNDDFWEVMIDTDNNNETSLLFATNPNGIRLDAEITRDATGPSGEWLNFDFDTFWEVAATVTEEGWFAEMRIPFSTLRFQANDDRVVMGLSVQRMIGRKSERITYPAIEPDVFLSHLKVSRQQKVILEGVSGERPVYITPYGLTGLDRSAILQNDGSSYRHDYGQTGEAGMDIKYGLTNDLTLDLTLNTDFAQIEADDQQVNLTRFSLFFPEKRQFFQERSGLFEFRTGGESRLFHSRRIGLTNDGELVRILAGARLAGKVGLWEVGVLNMQTDRHRDLPAENFSALRLRRQVFNPYSYLGGMTTSRIGPDGEYNLAYGVDGIFRLYGDDYLTFQWAHTIDEKIDQDKGRNPGESGRFSTIFEKRREEGIGYHTEFTWSGPDFHPAMGFVRRTDFSYFNQDLSYTWNLHEESPLLRHTLLIGGEAYVRNNEWSAETVEIGPEWSFRGRTGGRGSLETRMIYEDIRIPFSLDEEVFVPEGEYFFYLISGGYNMPSNRLFRLGVDVEAGSFFDGSQLSFSVNNTWNISPHLQLEGSYNYNRIRFPERVQKLDAHLGLLRISTPFNNRISSHVFFQYNSLNRTFSTNARFRYNFREGNDLWIVYNENLNTGRHHFIPVKPLNDLRAIRIKYTYTFIVD